MLDADRKVGRTPSIVQGCRPFSATNQPSSEDIQGNGMISTASQRNHTWRSRQRVAESQKEKAKKAMKKKPIPTMNRNDQNSGSTSGTVSQAAFSICSGVASVTLSV